MRLVDQLVHACSASPASMPSEARSSRPACLSSRRSTTRSPCPAGMVETRTSTARPAMRRRDAAVLRQALLGDVELGHDLDARHDQRWRRRVRDCSTSRSTPSTRKRTTRRFSNGSMWMSEAFSLTACGQHRVDQPDDRRVVVALQQVRGLGQVLGEMRQVGVVVQALDHLHGGVRSPPRRFAAAANRSAPCSTRSSTRGRPTNRRTSARLSGDVPLM